MAQAVSIQEFNGWDNPAFNGVQKIKWSWTSLADGTVIASSAAGENPTTVNKYSGKVIRLITNPGDGTDAPSDNYGVTILDEDGYDVLMGGGLLRDTANTEQVLEASLGICQDSKLSLRIAAAGDANKGVVILYIR